MDHGILAVEHPLIGIGPLDAHAGFVAGDDPGRAKAAARLVRFARKSWPRAGEHVHQRPFADLKAEGVAEHEPQHGQALAIAGTASAFVVHLALRGRTVELGYGARIQMSSLPALLTDALRLVDELAH